MLRVGLLRYIAAPFHPRARPRAAGTQRKPRIVRRQPDAEPGRRHSSFSWPGADLALQGAGSSGGDRGLLDASAQRCAGRVNGAEGAASPAAAAAASPMHPPAPMRLRCSTRSAFASPASSRRPGGTLMRGSASTRGRQPGGQIGNEESREAALSIVVGSCSWTGRFGAATDSAARLRRTIEHMFIRPSSRKEQKRIIALPLAAGLPRSRLLIA